MEKPLKNLYAVIIAGGSGERFWPRSREGRPKQFLPIAGEQTMLEATVRRIKPVVPPERIFVCTGGAFTAKAGELAPEIPPENFIGEPCGRNTAAAVGLSAVSVMRADREAVMAVLPADHVIGDEGLFRETLSAASRAAQELERLLVFGIKPDRPATGYGYIKAGGAVPGTDGVFSVERFLEKPRREKAGEFVREGSYYWNSGMFVWTCGAIMKELAEFMPELYEGLLRIEKDPGAVNEVYGTLPEISIDYGVMEKTGNIAMMRGSFGWGDIGSWDALEKTAAADSSGNTVLAENFKAVDARGNIAVSDGPLVAAVGVEGLVIAVDGDAVLVCGKDRAQDVKKLVRELRKDAKLKKYVK